MTRTMGIFPNNQHKIYILTKNHIQSMSNLLYQILT